MSCFQTLTDSHAPIEYQLNTKGGPVKFRAENWSYDTNSGTLLARDVYLFGPAGNKLLSAEKVEVQGLLMPKLRAGDAIKVRVAHVTGELDRRKDGRFTIFDFVPDQKGEPSEVPIAIEARDVIVKFVDRTGPQSWSKTLKFGMIRADFLGKNGLVSGAAVISGVGVVPVEVETTPKGIRIRGRLSNAELGEVLAHLGSSIEGRTWPEIKNYSAKSLLVSGPFSLSFAPFRLEAQLSITGQNLQVQDQPIEAGNFSGKLTQDGLEGKLSVRSKELQTTYDGVATWTSGLEFNGSLVGSVTGDKALPPVLRKLIPKDIHFRNSKFDGLLSGRTDSLSASGDFWGDSLTINKEVLDNVKGRVVWSPKETRIVVNQATWTGSPVAGDLRIVSDNISGFVRAKSIDLSKVTGRAGLTGLSGRSEVTALISGQISHPLINFFANGVAKMIRETQNYDLGKLVAAGTFDSTGLHVQRLTLKGKNGGLSAVGTWNSKSNLLAMNVIGSGVPLAAFSPETSGLIAFTLKVGGTLNHPLASGNVEAFESQLFGQKLPVFQSAITVNENHLQATNFQALRGAAKVIGSLGIEFGSGKINGSVSGTGLQLGDISPDLSGTLAFKNAQIRGTMARPVIEGDLMGQGVTAFGTKLAEINAHGTLEGTIAKLDKVSIRNGDFLASASGSYDFDKQLGTITGEAKHLDIADWGARAGLSSRFSGFADGNIFAQIVNGEVRRLTSKGSLTKFSIDDVPLGNGLWDATRDVDGWHAVGSIGALEEFIELEKLDFDPKSRQIKANLNTFNFKLQDVLAAAHSKLTQGDTPILSADASDQLASVKGRLNSAISLAGNIDAPDISIEAFSAEGLSFKGKDAGTLTVAATRRGGVWDIGSLAWNGGPGSLLVSGKLDEHGDANLYSKITDLKPSWFDQIEPRLASVQGSVNGEFKVSGLLKSPEITFKGRYDSPQNQGDVFVQTDVKIHAGRITALGEYRASGFVGSLQASLPFEFDRMIPRDQELFAEATVLPRKFSELEGFFPSLDPAKTSGEATGLIRLTGTRDNPRVDGSVTLGPEEDGKMAQLGLKDFQTSLVNLTGQIGLRNNKMTLALAGQSSAGGSFKVSDATVTLENLEEALSQSFEEILSSSLEGRLDMNGFKIKHSSKASAVDFEIGGAVGFNGTLRRPIISTADPILIRGANILLPSEFASSTSTFVPVIDPKFNLFARIEDSARLRTSTGAFDLGGTTSLQGTLTKPDLRTELTVKSGFLSLPNARIQILDGGTGTLTYRTDAAGDSTARLLIDVQGRTAITANPFGNQVQRYSIFLGIRGDLLQQGALRIDARSEPGDLSQDEIMTILGQGEALAGRRSAGQGVDFRSQLQNALTQIALPTLIDSFTARFAKELGVDYLSLDYNSYENLSLTVAKSFGKGLSLQYRRQVSAPSGNQLPRFDLRLTYQPRMKGTFFRHLSFGAGFDQDRPWKLTVEYSFRF